jgi:hypothetical protein
MNNKFQLALAIFSVIFFTVVNLRYGIVFLVITSVSSPLSQNTIFPLTSVLALSSFLIISMVYFKSRGIISLWYGLTVTFLWLIFFEILWQNSFLLNGNFTDTLSSEIILLSWLIMGVNSYPLWKKDSYTGILLLVFSAVWLLWIMTGYNQINTLEGLVFNLITKAIAFFVIVVLTLPRKNKIHTQSKQMEVTA